MKPHPILLRLKIELLRASLEIAAKRHEHLRGNWENGKLLLRHREHTIRQLRDDIRRHRDMLCPRTLRPNNPIDERAITVRFDVPSAKQNPEGMLRELLHQVEFHFREWLAR